MPNYVRLLGSDGKGLAGGQAKYYDSGWRDLGTTGEDGTYLGLISGDKMKALSFRMSLGGTTDQKTHDLSTSSFVTFQSVGVTVKLVDSEGKPLAGTAGYYTSGWNSISGTTPTTVQLMPGNYNFSIGYKGATNNKVQDISQNPVVEFRTVPITVTLTSSTGVSLEGTATYCTSGWGSLGKTSETVEILPGTYRFSVGYRGANVEQKQTVDLDNSEVIFNTVLVSFDFLDGGNSATAGASFYAAGWKDFGNGTTGSNMEMLPTSYTFQANYDGVKHQIKQDVGADPSVLIEINKLADIEPEPSEDNSRKGLKEIIGKIISVQKQVVQTIKDLVSQRLGSIFSWF